MKNPISTEYQEAIKCLLANFENCLKHGFFEMTIVGEIVRKGRRELLIKAGKSYKFVIDEKDLSNS